MCKIKRKTVDIKLQQTFILNCLFIACDVCLSCVHVIYIYIRKIMLKSKIMFYYKRL